MEGFSDAVFGFAVTLLIVSEIVAVLIFLVFVGLMAKRIKLRHEGSKVRRAWKATSEAPRPEIE